MRGHPLRARTRRRPGPRRREEARTHPDGRRPANARRRPRLRTPGKGTGHVGHTYLHSALDDHSRLAYTEALEDEKAVTAVAFWHRAVAFFAAHGFTPIRRCRTGKGSCHRSTTWADALAATSTKHKRTKPNTPRANGKVERSPASGPTSATARPSTNDASPSWTS
ncbi:DDE-type integrase/transposase/recombinase [Streptomyces sp. S6]